MPQILKNRLKNVSARDNAVHGQSYYVIVPWLTSKELVWRVAKRFEEVTEVNMAQYLEPVYSVMMEVEVQVAEGRNERKWAAAASAAAACPAPAGKCSSCDLLDTDEDDLDEDCMLTPSERARVWQRKVQKEALAFKDEVVDVTPDEKHHRRCESDSSESKSIESVKEHYWKQEKEESPGRAEGKGQVGGALHV